MIDELKYQSIADIPEGKFAQFLFNNPYWKTNLTNIRGIPDLASNYLEIPFDGLPRQPKGDIDVLLVQSGVPQFATAIQIKRIKVSQRSSISGFPNKLNVYKKGVRQANLLAELGFAQVYLYVFIVVDSRSQNIGTYSYNGLTNELRAKIDSAISVDNLYERVGLIKFDFTQPMDYEPLHVGAYGGSLVRLASIAEQPKAITDWVDSIEEN